MNTHPKRPDFLKKAQEFYDHNSRDPFFREYYPYEWQTLMEQSRECGQITISTCKQVALRKDGTLKEEDLEKAAQKHYEGLSSFGTLSCPCTWKELHEMENVGSYIIQGWVDLIATLQIEGNVTLEELHKKAKYLYESFPAVQHGIKMPETWDNFLKRCIIPGCGPDYFIEQVVKAQIDHPEIQSILHCYEFSEDWTLKQFRTGYSDKKLAELYKTKTS